MRCFALNLLAALSVTTLTACATIPTTGANNLWCVADQPISYSGSRDTAETIKQIREHNAAWRAVCNQ